MTDGEVGFVDVYKEFETNVAQKNGITKFKSKVCH